MNQYLMLRRLRGPLILITIGVMALLNQFGLLSFGRSWPLILIVIGVLMLAERVALSQMPPPQQGGFYTDAYGMSVPPTPPAQQAAGQTGSNNAAQSQEERKL